MTFPAEDPQNILTYQNDLNIGAWEGKQRPSITLKINPPFYSSPESINNVAKGAEFVAKIYSDIVTLIH